MNLQKNWKMNNIETVIIDREIKLHLLAILKRGVISNEDIQILANYIGKDIVIPSKMTDEEIITEIARLKNIGKK